MPAADSPWSSSFFFFFSLSHTDAARTHACKFSRVSPGRRFLSRKRENVVVQKLLCRVSLAYTIYQPPNHPPTLSCPYFFLSIFLLRSPRHTVSPNEVCYMNGIRSRNLTRLCISLSTGGGEGVDSLSLFRGVLGFHGYNTTNPRLLFFRSLELSRYIHSIRLVLLRVYTAGEKCFTVSMDAWYIHGFEE